MTYVEFTWQVFGSGEAAGMASVRRGQELTPCQTQAVATGSKTEPLWDNTKPVNNAGCTSENIFTKG